MPPRYDVQVAEPETDTTTDTEYVVLSDAELEKPYRVIIQNDDITPMEFVVNVLRNIFGLSFTRAAAVMLEAHYKGRALVTVLPFAVAHEKVYTAHTMARGAGYPLTLYLEPDE